jgi:threonine/homoserine/homoserine lactone efflux protein
MTWYGLSVFSLAYVLAVASPGPGVAAIIARSLGHGLRGAPAFIGGFMVGDLICLHARPRAWPCSPRAPTPYFSS